MFESCRVQFPPTWRNGSVSDSYSDGCRFKSYRGYNKGMEMFIPQIIAVVICALGAFVLWCIQDKYFRVYMVKKYYIDFILDEADGATPSLHGFGVLVGPKQADGERDGVKMIDGLDPNAKAMPVIGITKYVGPVDIYFIGMAVDGKNVYEISGPTRDPHTDEIFTTFRVMYRNKITKDVEEFVAKYV